MPLSISRRRRIGGNRTNLSFEPGWVGRLPFEDDSFDTVVCTHTLEHLVDLEGRSAISGEMWASA